MEQRPVAALTNTTQVYHSKTLGPCTAASSPLIISGQQEPAQDICIYFFMHLYMLWSSKCGARRKHNNFRHHEHCPVLTRPFRSPLQTYLSRAEFHVLSSQLRVPPSVCTIVQFGGTNCRLLNESGIKMNSLPFYVEKPCVIEVWKGQLMLHGVFTKVF